MKTPHKRVLGVLLTLALVFAAISALSTGAFADTDLALAVGNASFTVGSTTAVNVPVSITKNNKGFIDFQFTVKFDPNIFEANSTPVSVPNSSMLFYAPDLSDPDTTQRPNPAFRGYNDIGEVTIACAGVTQNDGEGRLYQYVYTGTGILFNLRLKLKSGVTSLDAATSSIQVQVLSQGVTTPFVFHTQPLPTEIPLSSISATAGTATLTNFSTPSSISLSSTGSLSQSGTSTQPVSFTAAPTASGTYLTSDIKWYVNNVEQTGKSGLTFSYTPPSQAGSYAVTAKSGAATSNAITITVGPTNMPTAPTPPAGQQFIGWKADIDGVPSLLPAGATYAGTASNITPVYFSLEMLDGAAVRMSQPAGLRFTTQLKYADYSALIDAAGIDNVRLGTIIVPTDYIGTGRNVSEFTIEALETWGGTYLRIPNTKWYDIAHTVNGGYYKYTGVIWNILSGNYNRKFSARAYLSVTYTNGGTANFYSDYNVTDNSRAVCDVAYVALTDQSIEYPEQQKAVLKKFVDGVVNIDNNGLPVWTGASGYTPPYISSQVVASETTTITVSQASGSAWSPRNVCAVTYDGTRIAPDSYTISGNDLIIIISGFSQNY